MGNKQSKSNKQSETYHYTSITSKKPKNTFLSPDNNICIIIDEQNQINIYRYCNNEFILKKVHTTYKDIQDVIYNPYNSMLLSYGNDLRYYQFKYNIIENTKITCTDEMHTIKDKINCADTKIMHASIFDEGNILLFVLDIFTMIAMKWNDSNQQYMFIKQYNIPHCDQIMGVGFHEKRAKMVLLQLRENHYYLNIYSIGQLLRCINSNNDESKIQSMDKPHLLLSRLVYENPNKTHSIIHQFVTVKNANYKHNKKKSVMNRLITTQHKINGVTYVLSSHFAINNQVKCKLIFSGHGDKILYQAFPAKDSMKMLHKIHLSSKSGHAVGRVSGWMNDFGATHLIDVNTGNSLWSTGESSKDIGIGWTLNDYLVIFKWNNSVKSRCSFNLEGFESETMIAECIFNDVITSYDNLDGFVWDLCLLIALFRGATDRWYREISLCNYCVKNKYGSKIDISLEINIGSRTLPVTACDNADKFFGITVCKKKGEKFKTHFYESMPIAMKAFGDEDVLIKYKKNHGLVCRNLANPNDVYGEYFRAAQDKWASL